MNLISTADPIIENDDGRTTISFGKTGSVNRLESFGFDTSDGDYASWTQKQTAWIETALRWSGKELDLQISATPFLAPGIITSQQVFIYVNGLFCGIHVFYETDICRLPFPRSAVSGRSTRITFAIPTATSPLRLGLSEDLRELGIAVSSVAFLPR